MGRSYRDLVAWQKAMKFVIEIYAVTQLFPSEERYGLINQLRRAWFRYRVTSQKGRLVFPKKSFITS